MWDFRLFKKKSQCDGDSQHSVTLHQVIYEIMLHNLQIHWYNRLHMTHAPRKKAIEGNAYKKYGPPLLLTRGPWSDVRLGQFLPPPNFKMNVGNFGTFTSGYHFAFTINQEQSYILLRTMWYFNNLEGFNFKMFARIIILSRPYWHSLCNYFVVRHAQ